MRIRLDPQQRQLDISVGNGLFATVFGMIFAAFPTAALVALLVMPTPEGQEAPPLVVIIPFLMPFFLVGLLVAFGRTGTRLLADGPVLIKWRGIFFPMLRWRTELPSVEQVLFTEEVRVRRTKNGTRRYNVYPTRIPLPTDDDDPVVFEPTSPVVGRRLAEGVAKVLKASLADQTGAEELVRPYELLDETVAQRLRREGDADRIADTVEPSDPQVSIRLQGIGTRVELPAPGIPAMVFVVPILYLPCLFWFFSVPDVASESSVGFWFRLAPMIIVSLIALPVVLRGLLTGLGADWISVDSEGFRIRSGMGSVAIPHSELEGLDIVSGGDVAIGGIRLGNGRSGIRFVSDCTEIMVGSRLSPEVLGRLLPWLQRQHLEQS